MRERLHEGFCGHVTSDVTVKHSCMSGFKDLVVWQKAHQLMLACHHLSDGIRPTKFASLKSQLRRSAESIPTNIVESRGCQTDKEASRFLRIALNSASELEYHLLTAHDLGAIDGSTRDSLTSRTIEVRRMLFGLMRYLIKRGDGGAG